MSKNCCHTTTRVFVFILVIATLVLAAVSTTLPYAHLTASFGDFTPTITDSVGVVFRSEGDYANLFATISGGISFGVCVLAAVSFALLITLLSIQGSWNGGGTCCIARERSVGIALLVFVMVTFVCSVISFAFMVAAYADMRDGYPAHYELYNVTVESLSMGPAIFLCLSAMVCALVTVVLVAVPCAFGIEYAPRGSSCFGDNSKFVKTQEKANLHSRTPVNCNGEIDDNGNKSTGSLV